MKAYKLQRKTQITYYSREEICAELNSSVRMFNEGRENVHDEARSGRPSSVNDDLMHEVNERVRDNRRFTISDVPALYSDTL